MHAAEREKLIITALQSTGFVSYRDLEARIEASPATIRRDLAKLDARGEIVRVRGGAKMPEDDDSGEPSRLTGTPFADALTINTVAKAAIGEAAAKLCKPGDGLMIDGGTTTFQMCPFLEGLRLQVLTNSLPIVEALLKQDGTRVLVPSGTVFREQNIILAPAGEESMPRFHAPRLLMGAGAISVHGVLQADAIHVASQRRFLERAEEVVVLADSSKFAKCSGTIVCSLDDVDVILTDDGIDDDMAASIRAAGVDLRIV
ncbi:DeoR/GlpR family DNA-binding transcription regulator [Altericroceibacterium endophyticum]|uniref:DeoR family transcriptional regulator n=1 Tax=Altericroceibacterium endophyticum TaxID=1808508 RepID=A0A6I4T8E6_9SPHN|nr:DeoR/GlpR family DNA-binding transcription regulator [Altericroceibacterium endophyticum]MXO67206.1 DeoR family transcriptional regulator [Altericroceibacterium endophyticum]